MVEIARERGASGYIGDGANRWAAVHRRDAARLYRLALEQAPAGSVFHAVGEEGVATRDIAEVIARHLSLPLVSVDPDAGGRPLRLAGRLLRAGTRPPPTRSPASGWAGSRPIRALSPTWRTGFYFEPAVQTA